MPALHFVNPQRLAENLLHYLHHRVDCSSLAGAGEYRFQVLKRSDLQTNLICILQDGINISVRKYILLTRSFFHAVTLRWWYVQMRIILNILLPDCDG